MTLKDLIRRFEGLRLKAYLCPAGVPTIGYGSTGPDVKLGMQWTKEQAESRLDTDAARYQSATLKLCPSLAEDNIAAISDFAYNLGPTRLAGSTLRRKLNAGDIAGAKRELRKWVWAGGRKLPGLVIRREVEASMLK
ncbi:MAG TPA: lysozyme [Candidatus Paceibacterota bacterium]